MECPRRLRNASPIHGRQRTHRESYLGLADARIGTRSVRASVPAPVLLSDAGREPLMEGNVPSARDGAKNRHPRAGIKIASQITPIFARVSLPTQSPHQVAA